MGQPGNAENAQLRQNAAAPSYDPVSGNYRPADKMELQAGQSEGQPIWQRLLKGGLTGLSSGLQQQPMQRPMNPYSNFYGDPNG